MTIVAGTVTTTTVPNIDAISTPIETLKLKRNIPQEKKLKFYIQKHFV